MIPLTNWSSEETRATFHDGTFHFWYEGRRVQKSHYDAKRLQVAISVCQPDVVIETGTRYGGSALLMSDFLRRERRGGHVVSIDNSSQLGWTSRNIDVHERNIRYIDGDSTDVELVQMLASEVKDKRVMVVLDSDHHAPHVAKEIRLYSELVTPGCFLVVEDGCFDLWDGEDARRGGRDIPEVGGPLRAIREWEAGLEPDSKWRRATEVECLYPISHSPCGWWMNDPHGDGSSA